MIFFVFLQENSCIVTAELKNLCLHNDYLLALLHLHNLAIAANTVQKTKT